VVPDTEIGWAVLEVHAHL